jgi:hypothetical protein
MQDIRRNNQMKTVPCFLAVAFAVVLDLPVRAQNVRLWSGNSGGAWLTAGNWSGGNVFAGATELASPLPAQGRPDDIMASAAGNRAASIGLNMSTVTAGNSGRGLTLGGIDWERTDAGACVIGNSSTAAGGVPALAASRTRLSVSLAVVISPCPAPAPVPQPPPRG